MTGSKPLRQYLVTYRNASGTNTVRHVQAPNVTTIKKRPKRYIPKGKILVSVEWVREPKYPTPRKPKDWLSPKVSTWHPNAARRYIDRTGANPQAVVPQNVQPGRQTWY